MATDVDGYPPLASTGEFPLHDKLMDSSHWWACEHPERPRDAFTDYDWRCGGCVAHAEASIIQQGDRTETWMRTKGDKEPGVVRLSWLVARARYWGVR